MIGRFPKSCLDLRRHGFAGDSDELSSPVVMPLNVIVPAQ